MATGSIMGYQKDPFEFTATGILGSKRDTMLNNEILLRRRLAKVQDRGYVGAPSETFTYGMKNTRKDGGVAEAIGNWSYGKTSMKSLTSQSVASRRDYLSLNKAAAIHGLYTSCEHRQFRAGHDWRRSEVDDDPTRGKPFIFDPDKTFGMPVRSCTPMNQLIEHRYQNRWLAQQKNKNDKCNSEHDNRETSKQCTSKPTRASQLRVFQIPVKDAPGWQMSKFSARAKPHLETFRNEKVKKSSFDADFHDRTSRRGIQYVGVYEQAKH